jgi:type II secretory pathway pseudopilin PulG
MKKTLLIILISIAIVIVIGSGIVLAYMAGYKRGTLNLQQTTSVLENSNVVQSLYAGASGQVTEISGQTITISNEGDSLSFLVAEDAQFIVFSYSPEDENGVANLKSEEITFEDIKVGDDVGVQLKLDSLDPKANFIGTYVSVMPKP